MQNGLQVCPCQRENVHCDECTISAEFSVGHLKMLYIRCLANSYPVLNTDIINTLIFVLIDVSNSVNDLMLKIFKPLNIHLACGYLIRSLDIASKKALYHANIRDLRDLRDRFNLKIPESTCIGDGNLQCCLVLDNNIIIDNNWKFCDLLSRPIEFCFKVVRY